MSVTLENATGTHTVTAWIADTSARHAQGLMFVRSLAPNAGMLFVYPDAQYVSMWMKNTYVSLDMLFIDPAGHIVNTAENAQPLSLATIDSAAPVSAVLELPAGTVRRFDLHAGDRVRYTPSGSQGSTAQRPVDSHGQADGDSDGVLDTADRCPGTPSGTTIDAFGCEVDSDGDGVLDSKDRCPGTTPGARVEIKGCEIKGEIKLPGA
jgi:uncharacterized membrane protein (UPF0127 family)